MAINYAEKNSGLFDQKLSQGLLTQPLETPAVNWLDAQSFRVSTLDVSGYKNHTRTKGFNTGSFANPHEIYTLGFDRDIEFFVDKADVDETDGDLAAANISRVFIEQHAQPEVDAYRFAKLATTAIANGNTVTEAVSPTDIYTRLKADLRPLRKFGPANLIGYLSSEAMDALERSEEFSRVIGMQAIGESTLESRVASIDGVQLVEVWDETRFATAFDFTEGFTAAAGASEINWLFVARPAVVCKAKFSSIYLFAPGEHTGGDGYLYQNRLYHDLFVLKNKQDGVVASLKQ